MSNGLCFQKFVEELRAIEFPVHRVTGGDIQIVVSKGLEVKDAVFELHRIAETRRLQKQYCERRVY